MRKQRHKLTQLLLAVSLEFDERAISWATSFITQLIEYP